MIATVKFAMDPIKCTIVVIYFSVCKKCKNNLKIITKMFAYSEIYSDICLRQLGIIPQKFKKLIR